MKKAQIQLFLIPILYLLFLGLFYFLGNYISIKEIIYFMLGSVIAVALMYFDENILATKYNNPDQIYLATRSTIFLLALIPLSLFIVSSSGSFIGLGTILTICSIILFEMLQLRKDVGRFHKRFLLQIDKVYDQKAINLITLLAGIFLVMIHLFSLR